jgi:hypothetical protein
MVTGYSVLRKWILVALVILLAAAATQTFAQDVANYQWLPPPSRDYNLVYRVNVQTGEVKACWYSPEPQPVGRTDCTEVGKGAGPQGKGEFRLVSSNLSKETGVFRVNLLTGETSLCYRRAEKSARETVCTPNAK